MININSLLENVSTLNQINITNDLQISSIAFDSRKVESNTAFIAVKGTQVDGHDFIETAISKGASVIICETIPTDIHTNIGYVQVENSQMALGRIASNFYENPTEKLIVIGVTGTNGKTSTTTLLFELFTNLGYKVGLLSTIHIRIGSEVIQATHTTPDAISIQMSMQRMVENNCTYCFMEVSSHAIDQDRIVGIQFRGGVFSNITHDHLDYHQTFGNYIAAKKKFFDNMSSSSFAITNVDDKNGRVMLQNCNAKKLTMAMHSLADYTVKIIDSSLDYMTVKFNGHELILRLAGEFNAYNALACFAVAIELGMDMNQVLLEMSKIQPVEGRIEIVTAENTKVKGVVDYAHTPDAVEKLLIEINKIKKSGKIITVIGCGGDRDKEKRPVMAQLAAKYSDRLILTSDNPRSEQPKSIIDDMKLGLILEDLKKTLVVIDRSEAIKTASMLAEGEDIIALVGKGHEKYQEINGEKFPFDDKVELQKALLNI